MSADQPTRARSITLDNGGVDRHRMVDTAVDAFFDDPLYRWLQPEPSARARLLRENFQLTVAAGARNAELWSANRGRALAVWSVPGQSLLSPHDADAFDDLLSRHAGSRAADAAAAMSACADLEPDEPHATLHIVAVHPRRQQRGLGAAILTRMLDRCDAAGLAVWLQSSNPANLGFYERLGFRPTGTVHLPRGPVITPMLRSARRNPDTVRSVIPHDRDYWRD